MQTLLTSSSVLLQTENVNIAQSEFHEYDSMAPAESTKAAAAPTRAMPGSLPVATAVTALQ
jgi:hypothetical protein